MADKTITDRRKSVRVIASVVETHAEEAAARLAELFAPLLAEGEELPDWQFDQKLKVRLLEALWDALDTSHDALESKRRQLKRAQNRLVDTTDAVYDRLVSLKRVAQGFQLTDTWKTWMRGRLPRDSEALDRGARLVLLNLDEMTASAAAGGEPFDAESWRRDLKREEKALDAALTKKSFIEREVEDLESERRQRLKEFGEGFVLLAGELEALYKLAGMDYVARLVRPSKKYPGRTLAEVRMTGKT